MDNFTFATTFGEDTFRRKYAQGPEDTWPILVRRLLNDVCGTRSGTLNPIMDAEELDRLERYMIEMKFVPGGRYLYYAGRDAHFFNNCFCLKAEEDSREEWGNICKRASDCLMSGGGIGVDYSILRPSGRILKRTGGVSSGPLPLMHSVNEIGRNVMQGGSRRSAIFASLNWQHEDVRQFLTAKDYPQWMRDKKAEDFNFAAPLDMTNISINWDTEFIECHDENSLPELWYDSVHKMCKTGEPGHCYNFWENEHDTLRNACTEFTSEDDSDVCNLGSINMGAISDIDEFADVVRLSSKFLVCGTMRGELPYDKVKQVREANRKLGLGLMGCHEWLLKHNCGYEVGSEMRKWLDVYASESERAANEHCDRLFINRPSKYRAVAPAG